MGAGGIIFVWYGVGCCGLVGLIAIGGGLALWSRAEERRRARDGETSQVVPVDPPDADA